MKYLVIACAAMLFGGFASLNWAQGKLEESEREKDAAVAGREIAEARYAEAVTSYKRDTVRVTRWATRYDTIRQEMVAELATDTVRVFPADWVRSLVVASDSTIAACRDLLGSCERLRVSADSTIRATGAERDSYRKLYEAEKPSRWDRLKPFAFGALGFYVGAKLRVR